MLPHKMQKLMGFALQLDVGVGLAKHSFWQSFPRSGMAFIPHHPNCLLMRSGVPKQGAAEIKLRLKMILQEFYKAYKNIQYSNLISLNSNIIIYKFSI